MRVAYVHDWLVVHGGAEKVAHEILSVFPDADVFSLVDFLSETDRQAFLHGKHATTSFIQRLPRARKHYRSYLPFFPLAIEQLDLRAYDLVISSSYAVAKGVLTSSQQVHICYCHSPMRYAWDHYQDYLEDANFGRIKRTIAQWVLHYLRNWDAAASNRVDHFIANSRNVQRRIEKAYRRSSEVIYPPVSLEAFLPGKSKQDHFLAYSRLVPYKRMDIILEAFRKLPEKRLILAGGGPQEKHLRSIAPPNVEVRGEVPFTELLELIQQAQAVVVAAHEDFGITPLEAQACGTPVIALRAGGYLETVKEGQSGCFFSEANPDHIAEAIANFDAPQYSADVLVEQVKPFSASRFRDEFRTFVARTLESTEYF
ncbi:MAG: glycosyltransferase family 4 protein [Leptolyngbya sp. SIO3F4]|nr:glycosyltransferase family 4 protein [Leptolyngbya sp. SIO3F4]